MNNRTPANELKEWAKPIDIAAYFPHVAQQETTEAEDVRAADFAFLASCGIRPDEDIIGKS